jgi:hypothetical protein
MDEEDKNNFEPVLIDQRAKSGYLLDTEDLGMYDENFIEEPPQAVHFTELIGSNDPENRIAYQFFKWLDSDQYLSYEKFFNIFGVNDPLDDPNFGFIRSVAFRPGTPERQFLRTFFNGISSYIELIEKLLEDLLPLRGLAITIHDWPGVPVRTLNNDSPLKFNPHENWPEVNAAWIGASLTYPGELDHQYYFRSFAICISCENRLSGVYWFDAIDWVTSHNLNCTNN